MPRGGRLVCVDQSCDDAEQVAVRVTQHDEVGVLRVVPLDPLSAQRDQTVHLNLLIGLIVRPQVKVRPVVVVYMKTGARCWVSWHQEVGVYRVSLETERCGPELTGPIDV